MKKILLVTLILLLTGGAIFYFKTTATQQGKGLSWNPFSWIIPSSSSTSPLSRAIEEKLSDAHAAVSEGAQSAISEAKKKIEEGSAAVKNKAVEEIGGLVDNLKESAKEKIAEALGLTPEQTAELLAADQLANLSICATLKNPNVTYVLQNPFSPPQDFSFTVDWGDGKASQGSLRASDIKASAAHTYESSGSYVNTFTIVSGEKSITIRRKICLE